MFLIWGSKRVTHKLGFVAEVCPRCCEVRSVKVKRIGMAGHIFFATLSRGRLLGFIGECMQCCGEFEVQPTDYPVFEKSKKAELNSLVANTNPKLLPNNRPAIESFQRFSQLRAPLLRFNQSLIDRYARGTRLDLMSGLALLATFAIPISVGFAIQSTSFSDTVKEGVTNSAVGLFLVGLIATIVLLRGEQKRFFRKRLFSEVTRSLKPLNPQYAELDLCLALLKKYDYKISKFVTTDSLMQGIRINGSRGSEWGQSKPTHFGS